MSQTLQAASGPAVDAAASMANIAVSRNSCLPLASMSPNRATN
jgi:hypothetical protein